MTPKIDPAPDRADATPSGEDAVLAEIGRSIGSSLEPAEMFERLEGQIRGLLDFDRFIVSLLDPDRKRLLLAHSSGVRAPRRKVSVVVPGRLAELRARRPHQRRGRLRNAEAITRSAAGGNPGDRALLAAGLRSVLAVPLVVQNEIFGGFAIASCRANAYSERHLDLAERIGSQIAGAIANSRLHGELQREAEERAALAEIGRIISLSLNTDDVYERFAEQVRKLIPFDRIAITVVEPDTRSGFVAYSLGVSVPDGSVQGRWSFPLVPSSHAETVLDAREGLAMSLSDLTDLADDFPQEPPFLKAGLQSLLMVPLVWSAEVIGTLNLRSTLPDAYGKREVALVERIAIQIAGTIANSRLHGELQREAEERAALAEIGRIISASHDIGEVYEPFAEQVRKLIPFDRIVIGLIDREAQAVTVAHLAGLELPGVPLGTSTLLEQYAPYETLSAGTGVILDERALRESAVHDQSAAASVAAGVRSVLFAPVMWEGTLIASIALSSTASGTFNHGDLTLAGQVGAQIAGAIANAELHGALAREAEERAALAEIGRAVNSDLDIQRVYETVARQVSELIPYDRLAVTRTTPGAEEVEIVFV